MSQSTGKEMELNPDDFASAAAFPVADIKAEVSGNDVKMNHSYPVVTPDRDRNEFMVTIRASSLEGWRERLKKLKRRSFPWAEVLLALSSLGFGAILSALISNVGLDTPVGIFFYIVLLPITVGALVAYVFVRHNETESASSIATELLNEIPKMNGGSD